MSFAIVSTCIMVVDFAVYCVFFVKLEMYGPRAILCISLMLVSAIEFFAALIVAISCCKYGCSECCCSDTTEVRFLCLFVCLFIYLLTQAGFSGSYAADVGLRPTASFPRVLSSAHLPTYERMDG